MKLAHYASHPHALRYGRSRQAPVYLASRTYGHCRSSRTGPHEARSHRLHVAERSATEFIEIHAHSFVIGPAVIKHTHCTQQPHPCTVLTAAHHIHARPPDTVPARLAYQRPLVNTYRTFDLCRHQRARHRLGPRRAFTVTRSGAGSIFQVLDTAAVTCLTTRMTLRLLVVLSAVARAALPTAMTTVIAPLAQIRLST